MKKSIVHKVAFIGSAGIPNRYGGFESFLEACAPYLRKIDCDVAVTCDHYLYDDKSELFNGVKRVFIKIPANGAFSVLHDLVAFFSVVFKYDNIVVLGVSGGIFFPIFKLVCLILGKRLIVNVDGVEWRRDKFGLLKKFFLRLFDFLAQKFSDYIVYDNEGLASFIIKSSANRAICIQYSGDHIVRRGAVDFEDGLCLTVCRIEPENNLELLIDGFLKSNLPKYKIIGNWNKSDYSVALRKKFSGERRLSLIDPVYDPVELDAIRASCNYYLHGHSVGGTNPSLVEILFYDCHVLCYDVIFNRYTAGDCASYFQDSEVLSEILNNRRFAPANKNGIRKKYSVDSIARSYKALFK